MVAVLRGSARDRRAGDAGLEAAPHDRLRRLGRRGAGPARLDRVGRGTTREELGAKAVAYVNSDSNSRGFLDIGGSHSLERFVNEVARDVADPDEGHERRRAAARPGAARQRRGRPPAARSRARRSGSTRSARARTTRRSCSTSASPRSTSASAARGGTASTTRSTTRSTTTCASWTRTSRTGSRSRRSAAAPCCAWRRRTCCRSSSRPSRRRSPRYVEEVEKLADHLRGETERTTGARARGLRGCGAAPTRRACRRRARTPCRTSTSRRCTTPSLACSSAARAYERALADAGPAASPDARRAANAILLSAERALTRPEGLPGRPWFRHHVYAPGFYTGYGVKTLPVVREAIEGRRWADAEKGIVVTAEALIAFAAEIERAAAALGAVS